MKRLSPVFLLVLLAVIFTAYGFQNLKQDIQSEEHEAIVRLVMVDVIVTKDGRFVTGLTADDFELYEDGKRVPLNSFELIGFEERALRVVKAKEEAQVPQLPQPEKKLMVIFDRINSWRRDIDKEKRIDREKTVEELLSLINTGNRVMVCQMTGSRGFEILQPYTTEEAKIRKAVDMATGAVWHLGGGEESTAPPEEPGPEGIRSQGDSSSFRKAAQMEALFRDRLNFQRTIEALLTALTCIKDEPGRKSILLISTGLPDLYQLGFTEIGEHVRIFDPFNTLKKKSRQKAETVLEEIIRLANSHNISVYSLDADVYIRTIFTGADVRIRSDSSSDDARQRLMRQESKTKDERMNLRWISEATGADHLRGAKKFDNFRQILTTDLNNYYLLSFYPPRTAPDGQYHSIEVRVKRLGVEVKHREGYNDYTEEETHNLNLAAAYYNPSVFTQLPFLAEYIPLYIDKTCFPWMAIALPVQEIFVDRFIKFAPKEYELYVWAADRQSGKNVYGGRIKLPFNIDETFMDYMNTIDQVYMSFKGPEMKLNPGVYETVFALVDPATGEIGASVSSFQLPDLDKLNNGIILNAVLGKAEENDEGNRPFGLSAKDGHLDFADFRFAARITGLFDPWEWASIFLQVYSPGQAQKIPPEFVLADAAGDTQALDCELLAELYDEKSKIWSAIFFLDISLASAGDNVLEVKIPGKGGSILIKKMKLTVIE